MIGHFISRALDAIDALIDALSAVALILVTAIVFLNAVGRYFLSFNVMGAEEASRLLMIYLCFFGAYTLLRRGGHVSVDVVTLLASPQVVRVMRGLVGVVIVLVMGFLAKASWDLVAFSAGTGQMSTTLPVPRYLFFLPAAIGATLSTIAGIEIVIRAIANTLRPLPNAAMAEAEAASADTGRPAEDRKG
ncbi:TRAP transporter small permease [Roseicyclus sp.]|uniref:TRAP transporter small permease n=1 Tax=Roseicyclus sp. TaxID=1914329 RepID=UPI003FA04DBE